MGSFNTVCHQWAVVTVGSCRQWAVVHSGQLSPVGSCPVGQLSGGEMSPGAVVGWGDVGASFESTLFNF